MEREKEWKRLLEWREEEWKKNKEQRRGIENESDGREGRGGGGGE